MSPADAAPAAADPPAATTAAAATKGLSSRDILFEADQSRGNLKGVRWIVDIDAFENGARQLSTMDVKARGYDFFAVYLAPAKAKEQRVLFVERNMWFGKPGVSKPVPISPRQKLSGGTTYGDIAATNYSDDYEAKRLEDETVDGFPCYVFDLKAANKRSTYDRIKYWVSKDRTVAVKAQYYTVSGKMFKSARFEFNHRVQVAGKDKPFISKIVISDAVVKENVTTMTFGIPSLAEVPDAIFDVNMLMSR